MKSGEFIKKIRNYSFVSFLLPLITIITCLHLYKLLGNISLYPNLNWDQKRIETPISENKLISQDTSTWTFTNCPKYEYEQFYLNNENETMPRNELSAKLYAENKIISVIRERKEVLDYSCIKNYKFSYLIIKNFNSLEKALIDAKKDNKAGFSKIINPYIYGEVSISRTARFWPSIAIFKPFIILSAIFLILYWRNNLNLFNELKNQNILSNFSIKFFYFGILSCIFLILHALFLGLDVDSKLFATIRKLIIILFIFFEVLAQFSLTINLYRLKDRIINYAHATVIKMKIVFVSAVSLVTLVVLALLIWGDLNSSTKHLLEWNYFSILLIYYTLSWMLWKKVKT